MENSKDHNASADRPWESLHIYLPLAHADALLIDLGRKLRAWRANEASGRFFFVRQTEGGEHIRLRVALAHAERESLFHLVESSVREQACGARIEHALYAPETERYGGEKRTAVAERLFCCSSEIAVDYLERNRELSIEQRRPFAVGLFLITAGIFSGTTCPRSVFFESFARSAIRAVNQGLAFEDFRARMRADYSRVRQSLRAAMNRHFDSSGAFIERVNDALLDRWTAALLETRRDLRAVAAAGDADARYDPDALHEEPGARIFAIAGSYVHMMNNRLGIWLPTEATLATLLHLAAADEEKDRNASDAHAQAAWMPQTAT